MVTEFGPGVTTHILEFDILQIPPDALVRVKVKIFAGQLFQMNASCGSLSQEVFDPPAAMSG